MCAMKASIELRNVVLPDQCACWKTLAGLRQKAKAEDITRGIIVL